MKKIMFNDTYGLTSAVLQGRKTMTRRLVKDANLLQWLHEMEVAEYSIKGTIVEEYSPYKVGEVVAIAQSYKDLGFNGNEIWRDPKHLVSNGRLDSSPGWTNKMFVRAEACLHHIRITDIKVERLQDISDEDCLKEGVEVYRKGTDKYKVKGINHTMTKSPRCFWTPRKAFAALIDKVSGRGTWDSNPWVFAYTYELVKIAEL